MEFKNKKLWKKHKRELLKEASSKKALYSRKSIKIIFKYAREWANKMEKELKKGKKLGDMYFECSINSHNKVSGGGRWMAMNLLGDTWVHGEELKELWKVRAEKFLEKTEGSDSKR